MMNVTLTSLLFLSSASFALAQWKPNFVQGRHTIVHLFEWTWNDIALECESFLGPYGYGGVQVSPVNENRVISENGINRPWFERYQPVSYKLDQTRSGTELEFRRMVARCNTVGVRIYVDVVINHMCGGGGNSSLGTGGSNYNYEKFEYPAVPYSASNFNGRHNCFTNSGNIEDYRNGAEVRNCRLLGLSDLNVGDAWVNGKIVKFMNKLIGFGVAGFRIDACKHMWPVDIQNIVQKLNNLSTEHGFEPGSRPFIVQEVIDLGGNEGVTAADYLHIGRITEFKWGFELGKTLKKEDGRKLSKFGGDFMADLSALSFVDNHDNQRGHGAGGESVVTFKNPRQYKMAQAFTLANVYGVPRVMSSFAWELDWQGPPHDGNYNTLPVHVNPDLSCSAGWICEHRWRQIYNMVRFRNVAFGQPLHLWWDNGENQIAFSRGNASFIAINNDDFPMVATIQTNLPPGDYCDGITGNKERNTCTGRIVTVLPNSAIFVEISNFEEDPIMAIHIESKLDHVNSSST